MTLKLSDVEAPLDDVEFPNGTKHIPVPFGPAEYRHWRECQTSDDATTRGAALMAIVTACYPTATAEDFDSCTPKMLIAMAAHAGRKIEQIRAALKNVEPASVSESPAPVQAVPASPEPAPLSPKTSGATSSPRSRKRSGKIGGTPTTAVHTASPT